MFILESASSCKTLFEEADKAIKLFDLTIPLEQGKHYF